MKRFDLTLVGILSLLLAPQASAGSFDDCLQRADLSLSVDGCTEVIDGGERQGGELGAAYFNRGNAYLALGEYERAISDYDAVIRIAPEFADAYNNRAVGNSGLGQYALAIEDFSDAISLVERAASFIGRAEARARIGDVEGAIHDYGAAIGIEPDNVPAHMGRAALQFRLGRQQQAVDTYNQLIGLWPELSTAYVGRAEVHFAFGELELAHADYARAFELTPDSLRARYGLASALCQLEDSDGALAAFAASADLGTEEAMALQRALQQQNYYSDAIDGAFGPRSNAALAAFVADGCPEPMSEVGAALSAGAAALEAERYEEALAVWRPLAEQGVSEALHMLGRMSHDGLGAAQDHAEAARFYRLAAEQGHVTAQRDLASLYAQGLGVAQDLEEAALWYRLAAQWGDAEAQLALGHAYRDAVGVDADRAEAARWYRYAAEQGQLDAQLALAALLEAGEGSPEALVEAFAWYDVAATQTDAMEVPAARDRVAARLTAEQLAEAEAISREIQGRTQAALR